MAVSKKAGRSIAERALKKFQEKEAVRESKARLPTTKKTTITYGTAAKPLYKVTPAEIKEHGSVKAVIDYKRSQGAITGVDVEGKIVRSSNITSEEARKLRTRFNVREEQIIKDIEKIEAAKPRLVGGKVSWIIPGSLKSNYERALSIQKGKRAFDLAQQSGKSPSFYTPAESKVSESIIRKAEPLKLPPMVKTLISGKLPIGSDRPKQTFVEQARKTTPTQPSDLIPSVSVMPAEKQIQAFGFGGESQETYFDVTKTKTLLLGPYIAGAEVFYEPSKKTAQGTLSNIELLTPEQQKEIFYLGKTGKEAPMVSDKYTRQYESLEKEYMEYPEDTQFLEFKDNELPEVFGETISTAYKRKPVSKKEVIEKISQAKQEYQVGKIRQLEDIRDIEFKYRSKEAKAGRVAETVSQFTLLEAGALGLLGKTVTAGKVAVPVAGYSAASLAGEEIGQKVYEKTENKWAALGVGAGVTLIGGGAATKLIKGSAGRILGSTLAEPGITTTQAKIREVVIPVESAESFKVEFKRGFGGLEGAKVTKISGSEAKSVAKYDLITTVTTGTKGGKTALYGGEAVVKTRVGSTGRSTSKQLTKLYKTFEQKPVRGSTPFAKISGVTRRVFERYPKQISSKATTQTRQLAERILPGGDKLTKSISVSRIRQPGKSIELIGETTTRSHKLVEIGDKSITEGISTTVIGSATGRGEKILSQTQFSRIGRIIQKTEKPKKAGIQLTKKIDLTQKPRNIFKDIYGVEKTAKQAAKEVKPQDILKETTKTKKPASDITLSAVEAIELEEAILQYPELKPTNILIEPTSTEILTLGAGAIGLIDSEKFKTQTIQYHPTKTKIGLLQKTRTRQDTKSKRRLEDLIKIETQNIPQKTKPIEIPTIITTPRVDEIFKLTTIQKPKTTTITQQDTTYAPIPIPKPPEPTPDFTYSPPPTTIIPPTILGIGFTGSPFTKKRYAKKPTAKTKKKIKYGLTDIEDYKVLAGILTTGKKTKRTTKRKTVKGRLVFEKYKRII